MCDQQHKYDKVSVREISDIAEIAAEIKRVRYDRNTLDIMLKYHPQQIRMNEAELHTYHKYLLIKWLDLFKNEMGDSTPPKSPHANYPEYYEYLRAEKGITVKD